MIEIEPTREVVLTELKLSFRLYGCTPVQADGEVAGHSFYFRARWDMWSFAVALTPDVDPVDVNCVDQGFYRESLYGTDGFAASYMPFDDAESIILKCAAEFVGSDAA